MGLAVRVTGRVTGRGVTRRAPSTDRVAAEIETWLCAQAPDVVRSVVVSPASADEEIAIAVDLHPAALPVLITVSGDRRVEVAGDTAPVGPGYHTYVCRLLERLGEDVGVDWEETDEDGAGVDGRSSGDTTDPAASTRAATERVQLGWLRAVLGQTLDARRNGATGLHLATPPGVRYAIDEGVATALGPRDDDWLERAVDDPRVAVELWPWWADATDGRYLLNRALCLLWNAVRWRSPATDEERAVVDEVLLLLRKAYQTEPSLPYPWPEWRELIELRGAPDKMAEQIAQRAARDDTTPAIGYRRQPVTVIHGGWSLVVPGSFAERRSADEWWGGESGRRITIAATDTADDGRPMAADVFLARVAADLGSDVMTHREDGLVGRARLDVDASSGVEVGVLDGFSAVTGRGAAIRVEFDDPADWQWAVDMWRGLRPI